VLLMTSKLLRNILRSLQVMPAKQHLESLSAPFDARRRKQAGDVALVMPVLSCELDIALLFAILRR
jgi:hypothetical protein